MRSGLLTTLRPLFLCAGFLVLHLVLLQVMARTRVIEKVMASQYDLWELVLILAFLGSRFASYFLVPAIVAAFLVTQAFEFYLRRKAS